MKDTADLPLHLVDTLRVLGRRFEGLKSILPDLPSSEQASPPLFWTNLKTR